MTSGNVKDETPVLYDPYTNKPIRIFADDHDKKAKKKNKDRRSFLRIASYTAAIAFLSNLKGTIDLAKEMFEFVTETDDLLLKSLFGINECSSSALVPAADHPWKPPPTNMSWYPTEEKCCDSFRKRFLQDFQIRTVQGFPNIRKEDSLYIFGSQIANLLTRDLLGNPWDDTPVHNIIRNQWRTSLHWNLFSPPKTPIVTRKQFEETWKTENHFFISTSGYEYKPKAGIGWMEDDYLLITSLPKFNKGKERILIFYGAHGPGTKATSLLLENPPLKELQKMEKYIKSEPWYQALFHVKVKKNNEGEYLPSSLELVGAKPLLVEFKTG